MTDSILVISPDGLPSMDLPEIITRAGPNAVFAAQEFFYGKIRNEHTRRAYEHAVKLFLNWIGNTAGASWFRSLHGESANTSRK